MKLSSSKKQRAVRRWPNKVAIHFVDDGRELTFKEIDLLANKVAHLLAKHVRTATSLVCAHSPAPHSHASLTEARRRSPP